MEDMLDSKSYQYLFKKGEFPRGGQPTYSGWWYIFQELWKLAEAQEAQLALCQNKRDEYKRQRDYGTKLLGELERERDAAAQQEAEVWRKFILSNELIEDYKDLYCGSGEFSADDAGSLMAILATDLHAAVEALKAAQRQLRSTQRNWDEVCLFEADSIICNALALCEPDSE